MKKILVTGGSGFCASAMVKLLLERGMAVRILDLETPPAYLRKAEFRQGDICDPAFVSQSMEGVDGVIHTAAKVPISKAGKGFWDVNVGGTRNVLEAAFQRKISKVVHISSSAVQMSETNPVPEDAPYHPVGIYARSKMDAEKVCLEYRKKGLKVDMVRPRTVIGAGRLGIFDILFDWISDHRKIYLLGNGENKIQFLHADDLADLCFRCLQADFDSDYNVGSKSFGSLNEDLGALIRHAKSLSRIVHLPVQPAIWTLAALDFLKLSPLASWHYLTYSKNFYFSNQKPRERLGWNPVWGNQEILKMAYDSYLESRSKGEINAYGTSHRKSLKQGILSLLKRLS